MQHVDIAIVGGGIVGLTLAAALKDSELNIAIIDKSPCYQVLADKPTARVSAINQANIKALQQFDVWPHLQQDRANSYKSNHLAAGAAAVHRGHAKSDKAKFQKRIEVP